MGLDRKLKDSFGGISSLYDSVREGYPDILFDDILELSGISFCGEVLDVGCGSGKATLWFVERHYRVVGLDISEELIAIACDKSSEYPNVSYVQGSFEEAELPKFDLITAAQAWHWVDPDVGYKKAHSLLNDSGALAMFWKFQDINRYDLLKEVRKLYLKHCTDFSKDYGSTQRHEERLNSSGLFQPYEKRIYPMTLKYSKENFAKLLQTFSWVRALNDEQRQVFLWELDKLLVEEKDPLSIPYNYILIVAKKDVGGNS